MCFEKEINFLKLFTRSDFIDADGFQMLLELISFLLMPYGYSINLLYRKMKSLYFHFLTKWGLAWIVILYLFSTIINFEVKQKTFQVSDHYTITCTWILSWVPRNNDYRFRPFAEKMCVYMSCRILKHESIWKVLENVRPHKKA